MKNASLGMYVLLTVNGTGVDCIVVTCKAVHWSRVGVFKGMKKSAGAGRGGGGTSFTSLNGEGRSGRRRRGGRGGRSLGALPPPPPTEPGRGHSAQISAIPGRLEPFYPPLATGALAPEVSFVLPLRLNNDV